jgi:hypothetical protein
LSRDPARRPKNARALRDALHAVLVKHGKPVGLPEMADLMERLFPGANKLAVEPPSSPYSPTQLTQNAGPAAQTPALPTRRPRSRG